MSDGRQTRYVTYKKTVGQALESKNIPVGLKDKIQPVLDSKIVNHEIITIKRAVNIEVSVDGKMLDIQSAEDDIHSMLQAEGITLKGEDKVKPDIKTPLSEGMKIAVICVETKTLTEDLSMPFKEIVKVNRRVSNTKRQVIQEGKNGVRQVSTTIVYEDDREVSRKIVKETVLTKPIDKIIEQGAYPSMPVSRSGGLMAYSRVFDAKATAYWAFRGIGKTYTASGRKAVWNPDGYSTIAVDPKNIPYGTKLFVEGYGFAIAADTGTAIKGNIIDVYFNTRKEACNWGVKHVKVYVLK